MTRFKDLVDAVYKSANLEGIAVTFAQTIDILNDVNVENIKPSDIGKVFGLRDAWEFCLNNIDEEHICCAIGDPKHQEGVDKKKCIIRVPVGSVELYKEAKEWKEFENIVEI